MSVLGRGARGRVALLGLLVAALIFLVALGSSRSLDRVGPRVGRPALGGGSFVMDAALILAAAAVLVLLWVVYTILRMRREYEGLGGWQSRSWRDELKTMAKLVFPPTLMLLAIALLLSLHPLAPRGARPPANGADPGAARPPRSPTDYSPHWWLLAVLAFAALAAALAMSLARRRRLAPPSAALAAPLSPEQEALWAAVEVSLEELEREPDPRRAVLRAYVGMEGSLSRHGLARRASETPLEHLARVLASVSVTRAAAERLIDLFERARFSQHTIEPEMKTQAIAALVAVRGELARAAG